MFIDRFLEWCKQTDSNVKDNIDNEGIHNRIFSWVKATDEKISDSLHSADWYNAITDKVGGVFHWVNTSNDFPYTFVVIALLFFIVGVPLIIIGRRLRK